MNKHRQFVIQTIAQNIIQNRMKGVDWLSSVFILQTFQSDTSIYNPYFIAFMVVWLRENAHRLVELKHFRTRIQFITAIKLIADILENPKEYPVFGASELSYVPFIAKHTGLKADNIQRLLSQHLRRETKHILRIYQQEGLYALLKSNA